MSLSPSQGMLASIPAGCCTVGTLHSRHRKGPRLSQTPS